MRKIIIGQKSKCDYRKTCYGIALKNDKLLVVYSEKERDYSLVGGGIEINETPEIALKREFIEESGYLIENCKDFVNIDCFWVKRNGKTMETDAIFYFVKVNELNVQNPTEDFHLPKWVNINEAIDLIEYPYQKEALRLFMLEKHHIDFFD